MPSLVAVSSRARSGQHVVPSDQPAPAASIIIAVGSPAARDEGDQVVVVVASNESGELTCDARALTDPDAATLDALARLQLAARRSGTSVELSNVHRNLADLLALVGLADVIPCSQDSGVDADRQVEQREELLVDEEVDRRDLPL